MCERMAAGYSTVQKSRVTPDFFGVFFAWKIENKCSYFLSLYNHIKTSECNAERDVVQYNLVYIFNIIWLFACRKWLHWQ